MSWQLNIKLLTTTIICDDSTDNCQQFFFWKKNSGFFVPNKVHHCCLKNCSRISVIGSNSLKIPHWTVLDFFIVKPLCLYMRYIIDFKQYLQDLSFWNLYYKKWLIISSLLQDFLELLAINIQNRSLIFLGKCSPEAGLSQLT